MNSKFKSPKNPAVQSRHGSLLSLFLFSTLLFSPQHSTTRQDARRRRTTETADNKFNALSLRILLAPLYCYSIPFGQCVLEVTVSRETFSQ